MIKRLDLMGVQNDADHLHLLPSNVVSQQKEEREARDDHRVHDRPNLLGRQVTLMPLNDHESAAEDA